MDKKIKLIVVTSIVAVMATGCSRFSRSGGGAVDGSDGYTETSGSSSQMSGGSQVSGSRGGLFSQQRSSTCAPCATSNTNTQQTQTQTQAPRVYKPATTTTKPYVQAQGQHSQQWYVDRWKRQQQAQGSAQQQQGAANNGNATYYDYSSAGGANSNSGVAAGTANTNVSTSNKSIYTGSYQQKTYKPYNPTTYSGGSAATTNTGNTNTTYVSNATNTASSGGGTYIVKKGDTVFEIMRQTGVYWKDIIKLNNLQAPAYNINPGQTIRLK